MPHASTREELRHWAKEVWEKITGHKEEEVTIEEGWIARDQGGWLFFYTEKPTKQALGIWDSQGTIKQVNEQQFPSIRWEDPEPTPCEITIRIKK